MAKTKTTTKKPEIVADENELKVLDAPETPEEFLPILNSPKYDLAVAVKVDYMNRFVPVLKTIVDLEADFQAINFDNPTKADSDAAKKLRLRYVREVRGVNKTTKDDAKKDALSTSNFIQEIHNTVETASLSKEEKLEAVELYQKKKEDEEKNRVKNEREALLKPYEVDTEFIDLSSMPEASFNRMLEKAKEAFELSQKNAAELEEQETRRKANEAKLTGRVSTLTAMGLVFDFDKNYIFDDVAVALVDVQTMEDDKFIAMIDEVKEHLTEQRERRLKREARYTQISILGFTQGDDNRFRHPAVESDSLNEPDLESMSDEEFNALIAPAENARIAAEEEAKNKLKMSDRLNKLLSLGLTYDAGGDISGYGCKGENVNVVVTVKDDAVFDKWIADKTVIVNKAKAKIKSDNDALIAKNKALQEADDLRKKTEADDLLKKQNEEKAARLAPDKTKLRTLYDTIGGLVMPDMSDAKAKAMIVNVKALLTKVQTYMLEEGKKL